MHLLLTDAYLQRITALHAELGIARDYGAQRGLTLQPEADAAALRIIAQKSDGSTVQLIPSAAVAWAHIKTAARAAGVELLPLSGFRSVARQADIIRTELAAGRALADLLTSIAAPGFSEHHTGCALDLGAPDEPPLAEGFAQTAAYTWLTLHAGRHGFHLSYPRANPHGIVYEPWHWCWRA